MGLGLGLGLAIRFELAPQDWRPAEVGQLTLTPIPIPIPNQDGGLLKSVKMESGDKKKTGGLEQGHHKSFHFKAASPEELELWVQAVRQFAIVDEDLARAVTMKPTLTRTLPYP